MNLETKITIYKFTPQVFTLTLQFQLHFGKHVSLIYCTPSGIRTLDPLIKSQLLYQLS